ncbi:hypothetical protein CPLU01_16014 [Colletotrichum plurivorum]|uniref:Uncharacterized protein n=1 Tax=Colletotrichum plurivorum TaxID=2175906 RepID=A0A8H6J2E9_9PEZI|nr:hypothetical protein CPLU01_16014 [Colletotrichum plurivorum]
MTLPAKESSAVFCLAKNRRKRLSLHITTSYTRNTVDLHPVTPRNGVIVNITNSGTQKRCDYRLATGRKRLSLHITTSYTRNMVDLHPVAPRNGVSVNITTPGTARKRISLRNI